jgi:hypothetical protein
MAREITSCQSIELYTSYTKHHGIGLPTTGRTPIAVRAGRPRGQLKHLASVADPFFISVPFRSISGFALPVLPRPLCAVMCYRQAEK